MVLQKENLFPHKQQVPKKHLPYPSWVVSISWGAMHPGQRSLKQCQYKPLCLNASQSDKWGFWWQVAPLCLTICISSIPSSVDLNAVVFLQQFHFLVFAVILV